MFDELPEIILIHWGKPRSQARAPLSVAQKNVEGLVCFLTCVTSRVEGGRKDLIELGRTGALPAFPYCKRRKAGRGLGTRLQWGKLE